MALERANGAAQVDCRNCGTVWTEDDYQRLVLILVDANTRP
jgi:hypothetical protein